MRDNRKSKEVQQNRNRRRQDKGMAGAIPTSGGSFSSNLKRVDLHGMTKERAEEVIDRAMTETERRYDGVCFIHGHNGGNALKNLIPRIARKHGKTIFQGTTNPGETIVMLD